MKTIKCIVCGKDDYPILRNMTCVSCVGRKNEYYYRKQDPKKPLILTADYLLEEYYIKRRSGADIAVDFNITKATVSYWLKYYEIPTKSIKGGNIKRDHSNKKRINSKFFSKINPDSAFLLGYLFTDGDLQHNLKTGKYFFRLYSKYQDNLEKALRLLQSEAKIQHRKAVMTEKIRQGELFFIHVANEKIVENVMTLGLIQNKNSYVQFPNIPEKMYNHFIRGCFAGSGAIYHNENGVITSRFTTGSINLITKIETEFNKVGLRKHKILKNKHSKKPSYYITYGAKESEMLFKYLYKNSNENNTITRQTIEFRKSF